MLTKENNGDSAGARYAGSVFKKGVQNGHCITCGDILYKLIFKKQQKIAHVCDNIFCSLFASPQFYTDMPLAPETAETAATDPPKIKTKSKPHYYSWLISKRKNYRLLVNLGVPCTEAARMCSNKQTRLYLERINYK